MPGPAKLKIVRVRSVRNDISVPFTSCPSNRRHSEYYSCQTVESFSVISTTQVPVFDLDTVYENMGN